MKTDNKIISGESPAAESPIIYIMVIGFHHKFGCQLEFVYPENKAIRKKITQIDSSKDNSDIYILPKKWAHLPSLALPDGSHNYNSDYIYFHLEDEDPIMEKAEKNFQKGEKSKVKKKANRTLFGISCYRQINASEMLNKDKNVTRNTLQKSVCILSTCPLYATSTRLKLHSITCAYFSQKDFRKTQILIDAFNTTFKNSTALSDFSQNYKKSADENLIGLSLSDLIIRYQHKILVLFKLILLQKKTLFQLKPVSNLSNTIISLISLIPDIFRPETNNGLEYCSGFFDSIDLVNCELERKATAKTRRLVPNRLTQSTISLANISTNNLHKKVKKKRMLSFSNKKKWSNGSSMSSSSSPMSGSSGSSPITTTNFNNQDINKPKFKTQISDKIENLECDPNEISANSGILLGKGANLLNWSENGENNTPKNNDIIKSNSSSATLTSTPAPNRINKTRSGSIKSKSSKNGLKNNESQDLSPSETNNSDHKDTKYQIDEKPQFQLEDLLNIDFGMPFNLYSEFNILHPYLSLYYLDYFNQINKMNTKLYCTTSLMLSMMSAANSADPAEGCKEGSISTENLEENNESEVNNSIGQNSSYSNPYPNRPNITKPGQRSQNPPLTMGYTIGATNVLFKQRLYDDIDVFIDETSIDIKQNDLLKKQLQLTTADLRFADYLIKHVNANRSTQKNYNTSNSNQPTLISVKKNSHNSFEESIFDQNKDSINSELSNASTSWEGSDEWIRLNFKWYFYTLLGSMVKEDLCSETRYEAEMVINQLTSIELKKQERLEGQEKQNVANFMSSSSSNGSLANEVVDIDDYIERASGKNSKKSSIRGSKKSLAKMKSSKHSSYSLNQNQENKPGNGKSASNSNNSLNSIHNTLNMAQSYLNSTSINHTNYHEDYNLPYLNEFKNTECYSNWLEMNQKKLEINLFRLNELTLDIGDSNGEINQSDSLRIENQNELDAIALNSKLQTIMKRLQHLDSVKLNHPFNGTMNVHDLKLRFNFLFTTTDSGKKINKAFAEGSKIMNTTGRAVGDALSQAKSSFSSFLSNWSNSSSPNTSISNVSNNGNRKNNANLSSNSSKVEESNQKFTNL